MIEMEDTRERLEKEKINLKMVRNYTARIMMMMMMMMMLMMMMLMIMIMSTLKMVRKYTGSCNDKQTVI